MNIRDEIRQLCAAHDRFMAEQASEPTTRPLPVSENDVPAGLIYKRFENTSAAAPEPEREPSDGDPSFEDAVDRFSEVVDGRLLDLEKENAGLRGENRELKGLLSDALARFANLEGKVDALFQLLGTGNAKKLWTP